MKAHLKTADKYPVKYKTINIDSINIFYREAGDPKAPTILLLHGFPTSSFMYRDLINDLAYKYHLIAPDYPGSGLSDHPGPDVYAYTFDHLSETMEKFIDALSIHHFSLYMQDFGGPVGFRIISRRPELVQTLIIQNANAYTDGFGPELQKMAKLIDANDTEGLKKKIEYDLSLAGIKEQYIDGAKDADAISPDPYMLDHFYMESPGIKDIQGRLLGNYPTNFPLYPVWQKYLRDHQPAALILWGDNDKIFSTPGGKAYQRDLKDTELHVFDGGHFVLEEYHQQMAQLIDSFLTRKLKN
jgi:pimeloyl-ACP methyl ester carboxylesterase